MVNVPPLLCSTPPPIDFGEDDEDVDIMPPTLDGVDDDEEFGDFLTVDDGKISDEPLPSPRPSSVNDLPPVGIYDGLIPPEEDSTNPETSLPIDVSISKDKTNNIINNTNIAQAFNYNIKNTNKEANNETYNETKETQKDAPLETTFIEQSNENLSEQHELESSGKIQNDCKTESDNFKVEASDKEHDEARNNNKNPKDLRIETSNLENKCNSDKIPLSSIQNVVSIEDLEDDLSDDELYSPKTPKNFTETDNMNDYFVIQEIKGETMKENSMRSREVLKEMDTKSVDSTVDNENEYKSCSSNSFNENTFDLPPPLDDQPNSIADNNEDEDDDFADFQDFATITTPPEIPNYVDNSVPVNDTDSKSSQLDNDDLEVNYDFINHNLKINSADIDNTTECELNENISPDLNKLKQPEELKDSLEDDEFDDFTSHKVESETKSDVNQQLNQNSMEAGITEIESSISQENLNKNFEDLRGKDFRGKVQADNANVRDSFDDFNQPPPLPDDISNEDDDSFGVFDEGPELDESLDNSLASASDKQNDLKPDIGDSKDIAGNLENPSETNDDDDFDDFADFEHHEIPKIEQKQYSEFKEIEKQPVVTHEDIDFDDDDDDDFGDFNTAQPITPTASSIAPTSQNISTTTATPMLTPKNLTERISKILQLMFNPPISSKTTENTAEPNTNKIQDIPFTSIDAAKALEYQWLNSDTRHSFIKSLGIDSKNILYGENWNPSLPRFAANLSFNPLKPMKPVSSSGNMADSCSILEPVSINTTESLKQASTMDSSNSIKRENIDIDWKSTNITEQTKEAFKDQTLSPDVSLSTTTAAAITSLTYVADEQPIDPASLTIFENSLDNEEKISKTPPISEMESVTTFSSSLPTTTLDMDLPTTQIINSLNDFELKDVEENIKNTLNLNEVVVTSTFTGSFKETHIYTPSKTNEFETKSTAASSSFSSSPSKSTPIDFDYEKAAMGVIIDETVVKKEYRDVEYNPPFLMESMANKSSINKTEMFEANILVSNANTMNGNDISKMSVDTPVEEEDESNDDFTEFQSVPSEILPPPSRPIPVIAVTNSKPNQFLNNKPAEVSKPVAAVSHGGMILSPAILIPQAIFMENNKPKIEWGDKSANINAEELARIEELFPEPKSLKSSNASNSSQKSTPTHQQASTPSISASVHNKEYGGGGGGGGGNNDDDDWSDFVSVPLANNTSSSNRNAANNNILTKSPAGSPFKQRSPVVPHRMPTSGHHTTNNSNNDDEWSDFVSSAPQPASAQPPSSCRVPQFNSGSWQNANFYNNPLSMYHKGPINVSAVGAQQSPKHMYNNNNNYNIPQQQQQYQTANNIPPVGPQHHYHHRPTPQQIHIMQNFSTAPVPTPERLAAATAAAVRTNQFQVGSAKVAPSIALIPDLGFVAPAIPTHTSFINSLPKPSINTKK